MMMDFYFQVFVIVCATSITGFMGWMAVNTWRTSTKFASLQNEVENMSHNLKALRNSEVQIAILHTQVAGLDRRLSKIEHSK